MSTPLDARILGTGIVSRCMALALAHQGLQVGLQARPAGPAAGAADVRAYALNPASVALLTRLRAWDALPVDARTPVSDMLIAGDAAGTLAFSAWEQAVEALAWIVDAAELEHTLEAAVRYTPRILVSPEPAPAPLTLVAEGKASAERERLGVRFERHAYGHSALAARLVADRPHQGLARQWFRAPDILALLPFDRPQTGHAYGLVWSLPHEQAVAWQHAPAHELEAALHQASGGAAGVLRLVSERAVWPLAIAQADPVCGPGWALLGDAAHLVHPLAGQGLNLGLADVLALDSVVAEREAWRSLGDEALLRRYARRRALGTQAMAQLTDGLWQLFHHSAPGLQAVRNQGMSLVNHLPGLKRWLVRRALAV